MAEPLLWDADGTPYSPRFEDIYRSKAGAWDQARHVFLNGCELPRKWADRSQWRVLETGFGLGLNFLATWHAWREDAHRPRMLHYVSLEAWPVDANALLQSARQTPQLLPLAEALAAQWWGLLPGWHRLSFAGGQVLLTLGIGDASALLAQQCGHHDLTKGAWQADSIFLDGFDPERNPQMWSGALMSQLAALSHADTRAATWTVARDVRDRLQAAGFAVQRVPGLPPKRHSLRARRVVADACDPAARVHDRPPRTVMVIGAGVAGVAAAGSLVRRGCAVTLIDAAGHRAAGASALPAGLFVPHVSPDDAPLSQITRAGVRATLESLRHLHGSGHLAVGAFSLAGVLEHASVRERRRPASWLAELQEAAGHWTRGSTASELKDAALPADAPASWHAHAGWVWPAAWIEAQWAALQAAACPPRWLGHMSVAGLEYLPEETFSAWRALDRDGRELAQADAVVLAAGPASLALLESLGESPSTLPLQALRGQVSFGPAPEGHWPPIAVNGHGSVLTAVASVGGGWIVGSTFDRDRRDTAVDEAGHVANLLRLRALHAPLADRLASQFNSARVQGWAGLRATLADRLPAVGAVATGRWPGLHVLTGLGARGLSLSQLCAELLAAHLHAEPLPVAPALARRLRADRFAPGPGPLIQP